MKKEISPLLVVAALVVLVAVLVFIGYRVTNPEPVRGMDKEEFKRRMGQYQRANSMGGGGGTAMGYPGGPGGKQVSPGNIAPNPPPPGPAGGSK